MELPSDALEGLVELLRSPRLRAAILDELDIRSESDRCPCPACRATGEAEPTGPLDGAVRAVSTLLLARVARQTDPTVRRRAGRLLENVCSVAGGLST